MTNANVLLAVNPSNLKGDKIPVRVEFDTFDYWFKYRPTKCQNIVTAQQVLLNPARIFKGIRRAFNQDGWCYVGRPAQYFKKENTVAQLPADLVYAVYMNDRMSIYDHYVELADMYDPLCPKDWENRFGDIIRVR